MPGQWRKGMSVLEWLRARSLGRTADDILDTEPIPVRIVEVTDSSAGSQRLVNTSGYVTEANSTNIYTYTQAAANAGIFRFQRTFQTPSSAESGALTQKRHNVLFQTTVTATAGGEIVAVAVGPPALASYQCCMVITHIWSDQTDGSIALTWSSTGGLTVGLAGTTIATVANTVSPDWNQGLAWKATADNDTIDVACAAGQAGNTQSITFCGYYWYET